jgi:hypothetical protein
VPTDFYGLEEEPTQAAVIRPPQKHFPLMPGAPGQSSPMPSPRMPVPMGAGLRQMGQQAALAGMAGDPMPVQITSSGGYLGGSLGGRIPVFPA